MRAGMLACWHDGMLARWHDGTMARWHLNLSGLCAGLHAHYRACKLLAAAAVGGRLDNSVPGRTYRERATLRSETGAGGYEPSGWMGGRLRKCFKGVAIHYGREGGGMRKKTSIIRVWGRLRRLQSVRCRIGSFNVVWWMTSEAAGIRKKKNTINDGR